MVIEKPQQTGSHMIERRFPSQRLHIPNRNCQMMSMPEFGLVDLAGLKSTYEFLNLSL